MKIVLFSRLSRRNIIAGGIGIAVGIAAACAPPPLPVPPVTAEVPLTIGRHDVVRLTNVAGICGGKADPSIRPGADGWAHQGGPWVGSEPIGYQARESTFLCPDGSEVQASRAVIVRAEGGFRLQNVTW